ncbi:MAG TPA: hypothetical protein VFS02_22330 [Telluria sp.]|nr:hypothetical protein [Telluria sp.]
MRITFTLSGLTDDFYSRFLPADPAARLDYLLRESKGDLRHAIKGKIGSGQFRDAVDFNALRRKPMQIVSEGPLPRRGYNLCTFECTPA